MHEPAFKSRRLHPVCLRSAGRHRERSALRQYPATLRPYLSSDVSGHGEGLGGAMTELVKDLALACAAAALGRSSAAGLTTAFAGVGSTASFYSPASPSPCAASGGFCVLDRALLVRDIAG
jgi:hypothetical protein